MAAAMKMQHESFTTTTTPPSPATVTAAATLPTKSEGAATTSSTCHCCSIVTKLMRKLKKRRCAHALRPARRQGSFQCRYDPLSYSLNFDTTGCGSLLDEDYYKFYAFSSRFVVNPSLCSRRDLPLQNN